MLLQDLARMAPLGDSVITLRRPRRADIAALARHLLAEDTQAWLSGAGDPAALYAEYAAGWTAPDEPNRLGLTLIVTRSDQDELVGVMHLQPAHRVLHVAYGVAPQQRRMGIASHALELCSSWGLDNGFTDVELEIGEDNIASQAVARRCGFMPTSRTRSQALPDGVEWLARAWSRRDHCHG
jgi:RimJ/RimL family protein N-acetyltransferase